MSKKLEDFLVKGEKWVRHTISLKHSKYLKVAGQVIELDYLKDNGNWTVKGTDAMYAEKSILKYWVPADFYIDFNEVSAEQREPLLAKLDEMGYQTEHIRELGCSYVRFVNTRSHSTQKIHPMEQSKIDNTYKLDVGKFLGDTKKTAEKEDIVVDSNEIKVGDKVRLQHPYCKAGAENQYATVVSIGLYNIHTLDAELPTSMSPTWGARKRYNVCYLEKFSAELSGIHVSQAEAGFKVDGKIASADELTEAIAQITSDSVSAADYNKLLEQNKQLKTDLQDLASNHHKAIKRMEANIANMTAEHKNEMANARGHVKDLKIAHANELLAAQKQLDYKNDVIACKNATFFSKVTKLLFG